MSTKIVIYNLTMSTEINRIRDIIYGNKMIEYAKWIKENDIPAAIDRNNIDFVDNEDAVFFKLTFKV